MHQPALVTALLFASTILVSCNAPTANPPQSAPATPTTPDAATSPNNDIENDDIENVTPAATSPTKAASETEPGATAPGDGLPIDTDNQTDTAQDTTPQQIGPPMDCDLDGEDDDIRMDYDGDGLPDECEIY